MRKRSTVFKNEQFVTVLVNDLTDILKELIMAYFDRNRIAETD